jgi:hypothetical protein
MSRLLPAAALALSALSLAPGEARAWYCRANSSDGHHGWASYVNQDRSAEEALRECAKRSRRPLSCHVINCVPD